MFTTICSVKLQRTIQLSVLVLLSGCATSLDATKDVEKATLLAKERLPVRVDPTLAWDYREPLSVDSAISYAIMHDAKLQHEFSIIVQRRAEIAQSSLPANPTFSGAFGIAIDGLAGAPIIMQGMQGLSWLWTRPERIAAAEQTLQQSILSAAHRTITLVADVRKAYAELSFNQNHLQNAQRKNGLVIESLEIIRKLVQAGEASSLEIDSASANVLRSNHAVLARQQSVRLSRLHLLNAMGCPSQLGTFVLVSDDWSSRSSDSYDEQQLLELAESNRLDLATKRAVVMQRSSELGIANPPLLSGSVGFNENFGDRQAIMPGVSITIALDGDAKEAIAKAKLQQAELAYIDALRTTQFEVRTALEQFNTAKEQAVSIDVELIRTLQMKLQRANDTFEKGELHPLERISIENEVLLAWTLKITDELKLALAAIQLELAVGGTFQGLQQ
jgi:outer membrane protein TolC